MTTTQFYHLTATPLERALPKLLEKIYAGGYRTLLVAESDERAEQLSQLLWTYDPDSFLPHGSSKDGHAELQPILLSADHVPANGTTLLFITDGRAMAGDFERVVDMFDGNDASATQAARTRWKAYKEAGHTLTYFKQTESGGWEKQG